MEDKTQKQMTPDEIKAKIEELQLKLEVAKVLRGDEVKTRPGCWEAIARLRDAHRDSVFMTDSLIQPWTWPITAVGALIFAAPMWVLWHWLVPKFGFFLPEVWQRPSYFEIAGLTILVAVVSEFIFPHRLKVNIAGKHVKADGFMVYTKSLD